MAACQCSRSATARRQCQHVDTGIAQGSEFTAIAGRDRIKKMAGPAGLPAEHASQITYRISKQRCRQRLAASGQKFGYGHADA
jgi:hypothetical protein